MRASKLKLVVEVIYAPFHHKKFEMSQIPNIFKAYDIRGLVDTEMTLDFSFATGLAFARFLQLKREPATVIVAEDMRPSSPELAQAFSAGVNSTGLDVMRIGLASTDMLYFASGKLGLPGAMFTASHNPAAYNGIKLCFSNARPIGKESGLQTIENFVRKGSPIEMRSVGAEIKRDMLNEYVEHLFSLVNLDSIRPLTIVIDAGNGMAGYTAPAIFARFNCTVIPLFFELDGSFPNHEANPIDPKNLRDLQKAVKEHNADLGLAFDGDADRCFLVDENGIAINPSDLTSLIAHRELIKYPGSTIIYNLISSRAVPEVIRESGGIGLRSRVGHSYIKAMMAESGAIFGGEHSGHFYFKEFWHADSGALAALHAIAALGESKKSMSKIMAPYQRYASSGEINSTVTDTEFALLRVEQTFSERSGVEIDHLDGLSVLGDKWWFNLRPSNTEPLLRLNVEAKSAGAMGKLRDEILSLIRG